MSHKIICGVDFGTTYTGVGYLSTAQGSARDISDVNIIQDWPGPSRNAVTMSKTPSRLALSVENSKYGSNKFGNQVQPGMKSYSWMKLGLDEDIKFTEFDDPDFETIEKSEGTGIYQFPPNMTATDTCTEYLKLVYRHVIDHLGRRFSPQVIAVTPIEFWFTVPAMWSEKAKQATRVAAKQAGFGTRAQDKIFMIPEPEAAAIAALSTVMLGRTGQDQIHAGTGVLVCDCGGGTVDLTSYRIKKVAPQLEFEELIPGIGGKCGSAFVDRKFHRWLSCLFKQPFDNLPFHKIGPGSGLMLDFNTYKRDFGKSKDLDEEFDVTLAIPGLEDSKYYGSEESQIKFFRADMISYFQPTVDRILKLLDQQLSQANEEAPECPIKLVILVGGFGDSTYLYQEVRLWCESNRAIRLLCPEKPQEAILRGAALRGLEILQPSSRKCRLHYGFDCGLPFRPGIDSNKHSYRDDFDGEKYCRGRMEWQIAKGQSIASDTLISNRVTHAQRRSEEISTTIDLWCTALDPPPERCDHPGVTKVGSIKVDFTGISLSGFEKKKRVVVCFTN